MATTVRELMSTPAVTCRPEATLAEAAGRMQRSGTGSVVVVREAKVVGILTERDVLRATAQGSDPHRTAVGHWMSGHPDVLGPEEDAGAAWASLTHHGYRHLPVVEGDELLGVVSLRDLTRVAQIRPAGEVAVEVPKGLEGVVVAETALGDVRGEEGFYHYRQYSALDLAAARSFEDVWRLMVLGSLPEGGEGRAFERRVREARVLPEGLWRLLPPLAETAAPLDVLRSAVSVLGAELGWRPTHDIGPDELLDQAIRLGAAVPTVLAACHRLRQGREPLDPRPELGHGANYLWMLRGEEPTPAEVEAVEQYMVLTIDHGFNASTFVARTIASTGADLAAAVCGAVGALSGPLHGGAPSRALDMLDEIGTAERARPWLEGAVARGERIMGFGHRVYKTDDPRSAFLRAKAAALGGPTADLAAEIERTVLEVLDERKPGRRLYTNVEFFAGVVMEACGIPREMFTPTFAVGRSIGWTAHVIEQAADNRLIRPAARYVGAPPPQPVPTGR